MAAMAVRASRGFTLPELMIVITVLSVMLAIGVPSFTQFVRNQRVKTASFELFASLVMARSEAITLNTNVTLTPTSTSDWAGGWTITYVDSGGTTRTLRTREALPNITIRGAANTTPASTVVYRGSGRLNAAVTPFELNAAGANITTRCITIDTSGRPTTKATAC
jgi:type IV fimbrial biogenesis protein FimT